MMNLKNKVKTVFIESEAEHGIEGYLESDVLAAVKKLKKRVNEGDPTAFNVWQLRKSKVLRIIDEVFGE